MPYEKLSTYLQFYKPIIASNFCKQICEQNKIHGDKNQIKMEQTLQLQEFI